jgi:DNA-binding response OmpR family regulator
MARLLLVEDNAELAAGIRYNLELEGHTVEIAEDGMAGLAAARAGNHELVILDVMLPRMDGFQVLRMLREEGRQMPVIMLTARGEEADKVRAFRLDADQYVTKPFGLMELIERINAQLRRAKVRSSIADVNDGDVVKFGDVAIDTAARRVTRNREEITLTPRAFDLLVALVQLKGRVATREDLLQKVWGHRGSVLTRTVDSHISELRQKLEHDPDHPRHILTVWKAGYRWQE